MILAGDVGGTNTRLAYFEESGRRLRPLEIEIYPSREHASLEEIVRKFRAGHPHSIKSVCVGVAGPVKNGVCETTNLPWKIEATKLGAAAGTNKAELINDLQANAHGIAALEPEDFVTLNEGSSAGGNAVLIAAGTGLGEAGLHWKNGRYHPIASEGGHSDFAPRSDAEIGLLRWLLTKFGHASYERVLSGPGLHNIYQYLRESDHSPEPDWLAGQILLGHASSAISRAAMEGSSAVAVRALDIFVSIYGAEAGNLALKMLALGGVFVGGGIAPKIISKLRGPAFLQAFRAKGRLQPVLDSIPVRVIMNDKTALLGAALVALHAAGEAL